ncbi:MAG: T9SS type A sorting domain-containing protein, partial [Bacteroidota bacterium]
QESYKIYPNPVRDQLGFNITSLKDNIANFQIIDAMGKEMINTERALYEGENLLSFDTEYLPAGNYYIHYSDGEQSIIEKFIKL